MVIKRAFNKIFSEESKSRLRKKYSSVFEKYDRHIFYRAYRKAYKRVIKNTIFHGSEKYQYRNDPFLKEIKREYIKMLVLTDPELDRRKFRQEIRYLQENGEDIFCYPDMHKSYYSEADLRKDALSGLHYVDYQGKKLFFKRSLSAEDAIKMINDLKNEQYEHSPHRYLTESFCVKEDDIVFDIGCAEGNFSLEIVDRVKHIYLFECDEEWIEALKLTFADYRSKVTIVPRLVSDKDDNINISIDTFMKEQGLDAVNLIKMDVEGYERDVLMGARSRIREGKIKNLLVCTYHRLDDEAWVKDFLKEYDTEYSERYMLVAGRYEIWDIKKPYFVHGLIRATHRE